MLLRVRPAGQPVAATMGYAEAMAKIGMRMTKTNLARAEANPKVTITTPKAEPNGSPSMAHHRAASQPMRPGLARPDLILDNSLTREGCPSAPTDARDDALRPRAWSKPRLSIS